jgi:small-conductance mechanosensitive channel
MPETVRNLLSEVRDALAFIPDHVVGLVILALAALFAVSIHRAVMRVLGRFLRDRHPYLQSFLTRIEGLVRFAMALVALFIVLPATPFDSATTAALTKLLVLAGIVVIGWALIIAANLTAELYLLRFRLDAEDNLLARKHTTQVRILLRAVNTLLVILTVSVALMTFDSVRQYGISLFASAGVAGLVAGLAARPVLSNLIAGIQLAMTQPIRMDDAVVVENEFGRVEEITSTYVVVRIWDDRRLIVPLTYFIEKPFQNWTREGSALIGSVMLYLDHTAPIDRIREQAHAIASQSKLWNGKVVNVQVTEAKETTIEVRVLVSASSAAAAWDLRCEMREKLIDFLQREHPGALPRRRQETWFPGREDGERPARAAAH